MTGKRSQPNPIMETAKEIRMTASRRHCVNSLRAATATAAAAAAALMAVMLMVAPTAFAAGSGYDFSSTSAFLSTLQAGAHPDVTMEFDMAGDPSVPDGSGQPFPNGALHGLSVQMPPGLVGNPAAFPKCSLAVFAHALDFPFSNEQCPMDSQVGIVEPALWNFGPIGSVVEPLFLLESPGGDVVARFGFYYAFVPSIIDVKVDPTRDYALTADLLPPSASAPIVATKTVIWGVPTDPGHDNDRANATELFLQCGGVPCVPHQSGLPQTAFMSNPTQCTQPLSLGMTSDSYDGQSATPASIPVGTATGCDSVPFSPKLSLSPTTTAAASPSGVDVSISLPQQGLTSPIGLATADLKKAVVTLPKGMTLNTASADGLGSCSESQIGLVSTSPVRFNADAPTCPDSSKVGTVEISTPVLNDVLKGSLYLADQHNNPFNSLLAGYMVAQGDGVTLKLAGRFDLDPQTGQVIATFDNNPQQPFSELDLHFKGGSRGLVSTPAQCGTYTTDAELTPWSSNAAVSSPSSFTIDQNCSAGGFSPQLNAGVQNAAAGSSSAFALELTRSDGEPNVSQITTVLPPGLVADLADVPVCPDSQAATGDCPGSSWVGSTQVGVGTGRLPLYIPQAGKNPTAVYLAGPYKGAPYSLVIKVPAQAGPFDLGTVVVRAALFVDPTDAHVTVVADPLPQIIQGIPLQYRDIRVMISRPGFMQAPTSCDPMQIQADVTGVSLSGPLSVDGNGVGYSAQGGNSVQLDDRFQVGGCAALGFSPKLKIALSGKGRTHSGAHPTLTATVTQAAGQANLRSANVALPLSLALDPNNSQHVCAYDVAQAVHGGTVGCPASTIIGLASAQTPLLSQPLTAPVYLVQGIRFGTNGQPIRTLPSLLIPLRGQIALDLRANTSVNGAHQLVTTFPTIPDAAISKFVMTINGGPKGILVITGRGQSICTQPQFAHTMFNAHSGKLDDPNVRMSTPCTAASHAKKHKRRVRRGHTLTRRH